MSTWYGFDKARVDVLHRLTSRAVEELAAVRSDDPAAADAMHVVRTVQANLEERFLPLLERVRGNTSLTTGFDLPGLLPLASIVPRRTDGDSPVWDRLHKLRSLAKTPGLPEYAKKALRDEASMLALVNGTAGTGTFAAGQFARARDALLQGAGMQYARDLLWGIEGHDYTLAPTGKVVADAFFEAKATVREQVGQAIATGRTSPAGLPDYVVVEYGYAYGLGVGGVTIVSSSGNVFTGPTAGVATAGPSVAARVGYITPMEEDYSGEEVDEFVEGFDVSAGATAGISLAVSVPLIPFRPLDDGGSSVEYGVGRGAGVDLSLSGVRRMDELSVLGWAE